MPDLLRPDDPHPVEILNPSGRSPFLLTGDHAGNRIPAALGTLGISAADLNRHIGWDIGVDALGRDLAARLDAPFIRQRYSRLVIDCNRDPASPEAVPAISDNTPIPGNIGADAAPRIAEIHAPYQTAIASALATRGATILVALHSFTPAPLGGTDRPWHIGVLHNGHNDAFARRLLAWLEQNAGLTIGDNQPYRMDATDHSVPRHAFAAGLPYAELEIRQDMLATPVGIAAIAALLAEGLTAA